MSDPLHHQPFPRGALWAVGTLIAFSLLAVVAARLTGFDANEIPPPAPVESRDLRFEDGTGGWVYVYDARSDALVATLEPGTENFVRGVLRGLARTRRSMGIGEQGAMRLTRHADGRLTLEDETTGRVIDLVAFGRTNYAAFARFLGSGACASPSPPAAERGAGKSDPPVESRAHGAPPPQKCGREAVIASNARSTG